MAEKLKIFPKKEENGKGNKTSREKAGDEFMSSRRANVLLILSLVAGIFLLAYPSAADYWNNFQQRRAIMDYAELVARMDTDEYAGYIEAAEAYNRRLAEKGINWDQTEEEREEYRNLLVFSNSGNMGYIDIPKINIKLPIYHGISEKVLETSIGHLPETSLPVGGPGSHCVLSGHRGLPSAKLFSDLDKIVEGDVFTLSVLNETYSYEVDRIRVVVPTELSELKIIPGQDLCTLVTCTPYGVNTHRLLVRGHRVANAQGDAQVVADALQLEAAFVAPFIMAPLILLFLILLFIKPEKLLREGIKLRRGPEKDGVEGNNDR